MTPLSCCYHSHIPLKAGRLLQCSQTSPFCWIEHSAIFALGGANTELFGQRFPKVGKKLHSEWSFAGGSRFVLQPEVATFISYRKEYSPSASWIASSQIARNVFTLGTAAVLPFYTLMVVAPKAALTKRSMESSIPYIVLGVLYAYLLYLSWTPDTIRLMFASKYWLPELPGIAKMFSNEMTVASAWLHLLAVDLFAARQVYHDGIKNEIETRHSVSLCLLFCPIGIVTHFVTKDEHLCMHNRMPVLYFLMHTCKFHILCSVNQQPHWLGVKVRPKEREESLSSHLFGQVTSFPLQLSQSGISSDHPSCLDKFS